ncbi:unnamed protein product [Heligmosomoides polygyrus]|uniref:Phospholipid scramblase n=1 Tax=Heligmosomoides polygyrus TaxID=6339 RepID=A0A183GK09_HELPZ|nr:unnamed protein product [Heligmosomoides polygyrus]
MKRNAHNEAKTALESTPEKEVQRVPCFHSSTGNDSIIAPQFTKIEPINILQKVDGVEIRISDMAQYQRAVNQYVLRNAVQFDPIEFDIIDSSGYRVLQASLYPDGVSLNEGKRKLCEVVLAHDEDSPHCIAKITHPVTSMTVYELKQVAGVVSIQSNADDMNGATWLSILFACGCAFTRHKWALIAQDAKQATIEPRSSLFEENSIKVQWELNSENEIRLIALSFGLALMVREAFPSLMHILKEFRSRRG